MTDFTNSKDKLYKHFLDYIYSQASLPVKQEAQNCSVEQDQVCDLYGELEYDSIIKLLNYLDLTPEDTFLDLGSGVGKLALTVYVRSYAGRVVGIEALESLAKQAKQIQKFIQENLVDTKRMLLLKCGNFLHYDWSDATVLYCCSTGFTQELMWLIGEKVNQSGPTLRTFISLKPVANMKALALSAVIPVECSWDSALAYVYSRP